MKNYLQFYYDKSVLLTNYYWCFFLYLVEDYCWRGGYCYDILQEAEPDICYTESSDSCEIQSS